MKTYTITSHVADQVAALEAASLRRRAVLRPIMALLLIATVVATLYFAARDQPRPAIVSGSAGALVVLLGVIAVAGPDERDVAIKRAGAAGEAVLPHLLRSLPDSYTLLNGVPVPGGRADIDHVLVGPTGVWAIEAKHHVGMVQCVGDAWGYARLGRGGVPREGHIGNPSQQARRAAELLERYLQHRHMLTEVQPIVVFTHPRVELTLEQPTLTILRANDVLTFLGRQRQRLTPEASAAIVAALRGLRPYNGRP